MASYRVPRYLSEDDCRRICERFRAEVGACNVVILGRRGKVTALRGDAGADVWKLCWTAEQTKNGKAREIALRGEAREIVERAWGDEVPKCIALFQMRSEVQRTCKALGIPYVRGKGIVWHDTRHWAVTNLVAAGLPEAVAMTVTGHKDSAVFKRYNVRRDDVQADALAQQEAYLER
jgi:integrase